ncbi:nicotinamide N-methyltransferase-like [Saccoglossus kowalevskii]|uniref:Nicotinamide N-methyltransferase-like n=1 Tax=Saccoglossus kowalevskii TaxID=10224 RepID=A0ABM0GUD0_SACKO|nr:PREDICTED: nicotinamide N-methyltransferase-like [Saccoglossus kowalevskii]
MAAVYHRVDYDTHFNPEKYIQVVMSLIEYNRRFHVLLQKSLDTGKFCGDRMIDIGSGPNIHQLIPLCMRYKEIVCAEYTESCRRVLQNWKEKKRGSLDWTPCFKYVCGLEGNNGMLFSDETSEERENNLRKAIKEIIPCDVTKANPLEPRSDYPFDAMFTSLCLECASPDSRSYRQAVVNMASLLKPGGRLILWSFLNGTSYTIGETEFPILKVSEGFVKSALKEAGFIDIETTQVFYREDSDTTALNIGGFLYLTATKKARTQSVRK